MGDVWLVIAFYRDRPGQTLRTFISLDRARQWVSQNIDSLGRYQIRSTSIVCDIPKGATE